MKKIKIHTRHLIYLAFLHLITPAKTHSSVLYVHELISVEKTFFLIQLHLLRSSSRSIFKKTTTVVGHILVTKHTCQPTRLFQTCTYITYIKKKEDMGILFLKSRNENRTLNSGANLILGSKEMYFSFLFTVLRPVHMGFFGLKGSQSSVKTKPLSVLFIQRDKTSFKKRSSCWYVSMVASVKPSSQALGLLEKFPLLSTSCPLAGTVAPWLWSSLPRRTGCIQRSAFRLPPSSSTAASSRGGTRGSPEGRASGSLVLPAPGPRGSPCLHSEQWQSRLIIDNYSDLVSLSGFGPVLQISSHTGRASRWTRWHDTERLPQGAPLQLKLVMSRSWWHVRSRIRLLPLCASVWIGLFHSGREQSSRTTAEKQDVMTVGCQVMRSEGLITTLYI